MKLSKKLKDKNTSVAEVQSQEVEARNDNIRQLARTTVQHNVLQYGPIQGIEYFHGCSDTDIVGDERVKWYDDIKTKGMVVNEDGNIGIINDGSLSGIIPGIAFYKNDFPDDEEDNIEFEKGVMIANTHQGFRYVGTGADDIIVDLGPVTAPTLVGIQQPEALLVPLNNMQGIMNAVNFLGDYAEIAGDVSKKIMDARFQLQKENNK